MRRRTGWWVARVAAQLAMIVVLAALWYFGPGRGSGDERLAMALFAGTLGSFAPLLSARLATYLRRGGTGRTAERECRWRTYDGGRPARRWGGGWLRNQGSTLALVLPYGRTGPRLEVSSVRGVTVREPARREPVSPAMRVLEVTYDGGRMDLAVPAADVELVRRWLGA